MSLRLPSQKRFAPSRPKLGSRPGGPSIGPAKPASTSGFAQPSLPNNAQATGEKSSDDRSEAPGVADGSRGTGNGTDNAEAGPSSRPYTGLNPDAQAGPRSSPIPSKQLLAARRSTSPVKRSAGLPSAPATEPFTDADIGVDLASGLNGKEGSKTADQSRPAPSASPRPPSASPATAHRALPPPSPGPRPSASPAVFARPLPPSSVGRAPSASPAPRSFPRISASPAPSNRERSVSRQPSATPSARSGGRPALIAAAENRANPLNLPITAKERRKAERDKEKERRGRKESESQRGTPAPVQAAYYGLPPTVQASSAETGGSETPGRASPPPRKEKESSAVLADRLVQQIRDMDAGRQSVVPDEDTSVPLFDPAPEDEDLAGYTGRPRYGSSVPRVDQAEDGSDKEEHDETTNGNATVRKRAKNKGPSGRQRSTSSQAQSRPVRRPVAAQRNRYRRLTAPRPVPEEEAVDEETAEAEPENVAEGPSDEGAEADPPDNADDADENLNELDISDDENVGSQVSGTPRARKRKRLEKIKRRPQSPVFPTINLEVVEAGEMLGERVDEETMRMAEIATKRSGEGKVSSRAKELHVHLREASQRNQTRLDDEFKDRYERRQILRRQIRALRNAKRGEKRGLVSRSGGDPEAEVSEDEMDSETEFPVKPEQLTPESSPEPGGARRSTRMVVDEDGMEIEEEEYVAPPEGAEVEEAVDDIEEDTYDPTAHAGADADAGAADDGVPVTEDHEGEAFDADLAAMGFTSGPTRDGDEDEWADPDADGPSLEELYEQMEEDRRSAMRRNEQREVVEDEQTGRMPNNQSYRKKVANERWSKEETEFFYQVLGETGENYSLMALYFPQRNQRQLKNKGKREGAAFPERVNEAIRARRPIDPDYLHKTVGYDPRGPTEAADELLEDTRELPARWTKEDTDRAQTAGLGDGEEGEEHVEETVYQEGDGADAGAEQGEIGEEGEEDYEEGADGDEGDEDKGDEE